ncbi:M23/M56 family metallopeptidase [Altererythrobacter lutimaris]|uniref:Peptidoglycan DD-metalloendopeptidase family protein n=1 Tax=Altererythrobacter lutimaris TaxID=2743979 RepID=A0A850HI92_9SPHN|nr:M23/M56 family metallopeptidase [Altererythrobacter lutimaris]NVE95152.1 peptidoglycan DD-metalloendopeptidase family protein [Altererythrobacter lutimaris]
MSEMLFYLLALLATGGIICLTLFAVSSAMPILKFWGGLWATGLIVSVFIPLAGGALTVLAPSMQTPAILSATPGVLHTVFDASLFSGPGEMTGNVSPIIIRDVGPTLLLGLYITVLLTGLIRLIAGRRRAQAMAFQAQGPYELDGIAFWVSSEAGAPFAISRGFGQDNARIIMPARFEAQLNDLSLSLILRHEQAHIKRRDDQLGLLLRVVVAVCWFSPFAHILFARWSQSAEIQCDAAAVANRPTEMRRVFANTLLEALHITADRVRQYPAASFSTHRIWSEKMRITQIMKGSPAVFKRSVGAIVLACLAVPATAIGAMSIAAHGKQAAYTVTTPPATQVIAHIKIVEGKITARFGQRADPFDDGKIKTHNGIDIAAPIGTPIRAPSDGVIVEATKLFDNKPAYGLVVVHMSGDGTQTLFSHLDEFSVVTGQSVTAGQEIAKVGNSGRSTGPHVHVETIRNGERVDPLSIWPTLQ